jgi:phosphatidylglycerophosphate synthase
MTTLIREAWERARASSGLRFSAFAWLALGLGGSELLTIVLARDAHVASKALVAGDAAAWFFCSAVLLTGLSLLKNPDGTIVNKVGIPNGLTLIRAWACYPMMLCAFLPLPGSDGFVFWVAIAAPVGYFDIVDGIVARTLGPITVLGKGLDPAVDALYFSCGVVGGVALHVFSPWIMVLTLVRYLGPLLLTPVVLALGKRPELVHTVWGRHNTLLTGWVALACTIVRATGHDAVTTSLIIGLPLLVPTTLLHFYSLWKRVTRAPDAAHEAVRP